MRGHLWGKVILKEELYGFQKVSTQVKTFLHKSALDLGTLNEMRLG